MTFAITNFGFGAFNLHHQQKFVKIFLFFGSFAKYYYIHVCKIVFGISDLDQFIIIKVVLVSMLPIAGLLQVSAPAHVRSAHL